MRFVTRTACRGKTEVVRTYSSYAASKGSFHKVFYGQLMSEKNHQSTVRSSKTGKSLAFNKTKRKENIE